MVKVKEVMKKYTLIIAIIVITTLTLLVACGAETPTTEPGPEQSPAPVTPSAEPDTEPGPSPSPKEGPSGIPHTIEGRDNCLMCHETGIGDAEKIPADHAGRANETCTGCHEISK